MRIFSSERWLLFMNFISLSIGKNNQLRLNFWWRHTKFLWLCFNFLGRQRVK